MSQNWDFDILEDATEKYLEDNFGDSFERFEIEINEVENVLNINGFYEDGNGYPINTYEVTSEGLDAVGIPVPFDGMGDSTYEEIGEEIEEVYDQLQ